MERLGRLRTGPTGGRSSLSLPLAASGRRGSAGPDRISHPAVARRLTINSPPSLP